MAAASNGEWFVGGRVELSMIIIKLRVSGSSQVEHVLQAIEVENHGIANVIVESGVHLLTFFVPSCKALH